MRAKTNTDSDITMRVAPVTLPLAWRGTKSLYVYCTLILFALVFAMGAWGWVSFSREEGGPVGLFTQTDFPAITIASRLVSQGRGGALYHRNAQQQLDTQLEGQRELVTEGYLALSPGADLKYPYPYTPFIAVLMSPLTGLSPLVGMALWDLLNIACMAWGLWFLLCTLSLPRMMRLFILLSALTSLPFIINLEQGQSSGIVMLGLALGIGLLKRERALPAGLAFGLLVLKIQWLPLLALALLWKRRWRTLAGIAATSCALLLVTVLVAGTGWIPDYLNVLGKAQQYDRTLLLDPWYSHSFPGGLTALIGRGAGADTDGIARFANLAMTIGFAALLLYLWKADWQPATRRWDGLMALTMLAAIFTNQQLNTHDLCLLALPAALGISYFYGLPGQIRTKIVWFVLLWAAYIVPTLFLPQVFSLPVRMTTLLMALMLGLLVYSLLRKEDNVRLKGSHS